MSRQCLADVRDWLPASGATIVSLFAYMPDKQVHTNDVSSLRRLMRTRRKPLALLLSLPGVWCSLAAAQEAPPPDIAKSEGLELRTVPALVDNPLAAGEDVPMYVRGMHLTGRTNVDATVDGDAEARKYRSFVKGDRLTYDQDTDEVVARGNARLSQGGNLFIGPEAHMYTGAGDGYMLTPTYKLVSGGGGKSERADVEASNLVTLKRGTYSACACTEDGKTPAWYIKASEFEFDQDQQEGTAYNGVLFFQNVPILASPYLSFPTSNERRSGFLAPTFTQSSRTGFELATPYYFNIAPNRDLTITPRFMTKRGVMLMGDFRYLEPTYAGLFHLEYLPKDRVTGDARYTFTFQHSQSLGYGVNAYVNFTKVSDDTYPDDFGSGTNFQTGVQRVYNREAGLTWNYGDWSFLARVLKYQTLAPSTPQYESVPELSATYNKFDFHGFDFSMPIRYNRFQIASSTGQPNGERLYAQPTLSYPILTPGYFVVPKVMFNAAAYNVDYPNGSMMQSSITRTVRRPCPRSHAGCPAHPVGNRTAGPPGRRPGTPATRTTQSCRKNPFPPKTRCTSRAAAARFFEPGEGLLGGGEVGHLGQPEGGPEVGPVGQVGGQPAVVGAEELLEGGQGEQLVLGEVLAAELRRVRRQGVPGDRQGGPGDGERRLGGGAGGRHARLEGYNTPGVSTQYAPRERVGRRSPPGEGERPRQAGDANPPSRLTPPVTSRTWPPCSGTRRSTWSSTAAAPGPPSPPRNRQGAG